MRLYENEAISNNAYTFTRKQKKKFCSTSMLQFIIYIAFLTIYNYYCYKYFQQRRKRKCNITTNLRTVKATVKTITSDCKSPSNANCVHKLWKGNAIQTYPKNNTYELSVVISYCDGDLDIFTEYLVDWKSIHNIIIRSMTIICRCGTKPSDDIVPKNAEVILSNKDTNYPDLNYIQWLIDQLSKKVLEQVVTTNPNHILLFLNARALSTSTMSLNDVILSTIENGFSCVQTPPNDQSIYHDYNTLLTFKPTTAKDGPYKNLGNWLSQFNLKHQELVSVCFGSSFALKSDDLLVNGEHYYSILKSIEENLQRDGDRQEVKEFMERAWAGIFAYPLDQGVVGEIRKYSGNFVKEDCCSYTGALMK